MYADSWHDKQIQRVGDRTKENEPCREMCRAAGKTVLEIRDLRQGPKHIIIADVLRTALTNKHIQHSELEKQVMETVVNALVK